MARIPEDEDNPQHKTRYLLHAAEDFSDPHWHPMGEGSWDQYASFSIDDLQASDFMTQMWNSGIRPKTGLDNNDVVAVMREQMISMKNHIEDLREQLKLKREQK